MYLGEPGSPLKEALQWALRQVWADHLCMWTILVSRAQGNLHPSWKSVKETGDLMILMGMKLGIHDFDGNETGDLMVLMGMKLGI